MNMECPKGLCDYEAKELRSVSQHWRMSHTGSLRDEHPELYGLTIKCDVDNCGRVFESDYAKNYHISYSHRDSYHECQECGEIFYRPPSNLSENFVFCSIKCRNGNEKWKNSISDSVSQIWESEEHRSRVINSSKGQKPSYPNKRFIDELGHYVDSTWEEIVGLALVKEDIDYETEPEFQRPCGRSYYPDFVVGGSVIEVKGYADEESIAKAKEFRKEYPEYQYIVFGAEMPSDVHISVERSSEDAVLERIPKLLESL